MSEHKLMSPSVNRAQFRVTDEIHTTLYKFIAASTAISYNVSHKRNIYYLHSIYIIVSQNGIVSVMYATVKLYIQVFT